MAGQRQPIALVQAKGKKHLTKAEIAERERTEVKAPSDRVTPPSYLTATQKKAFRKTVKELRAIDLISNLDVEALARLVIAQEKYREVTETIAKQPLMVTVAYDTGKKDAETPNLKQIKYAIKKKGGILKTTRELLQDTAVNILAYLNKWIAKKSRATRNAAILNVINTITKGKEVAVATFDDFKDVFNVKLDPAIAVSSIVLTNQDGFNYMDKLKDKDGKYIMQPDPTDATKTLLFGKYPVKVVSNKTLKSTNVLKGGSGSDKNDVTGYKYPVYMGDLKEAVTLFDREKMTIELSTEAGDLWAKDLTGIKVRDRFDVQSVDETAVVKGEISVAVAG